MTSINGHERLESPVFVPNEKWGNSDAAEIAAKLPLVLHRSLKSVRLTIEADIVYAGITDFSLVFSKDKKPNFLLFTLPSEFAQYPYNLQARATENWGLADRRRVTAYDPENDLQESVYSLTSCKQEIARVPVIYNGRVYIPSSRAMRETPIGSVPAGPSPLTCAVIYAGALDREAYLLTQKNPEIAADLLGSEVCEHYANRFDLEAKQISVRMHRAGGRLFDMSPVGVASSRGNGRYAPSSVLTGLRS